MIYETYTLHGPGPGPAHARSMSHNSFYIHIYIYAEIEKCTLCFFGADFGFFQNAEVEKCALNLPFLTFLRNMDSI